MRRFITFLSCLSLLAGVSAPCPSEAAAIAEVSSRAGQAQKRVREIKSRGWGKDAQLQAIQVIGPVVLDFVAASDLARAVKRQRSRVRNIYEMLNGPLEEIYNESFSKLDRMSKAVMDQDGDLEALYETREWQDAQQLASQALYFLNWLRYVGSFVVDANKKETILKAAVSGFSEFAAGEQRSQLRRESLFGRALCEKELQEFEWAIRDFELLLKDPGLAADMRRKVQTALADTRTLARGGKQRSPSPDDIAQTHYARAQALLRASKKQRGSKRTKSRSEAMGLIVELQKQGGAWKDKADALARAELTAEEQLLVAEEQDPFPPWKKAKEHMQKRRFAKAVPFLREVLASADPKADRYKRDARYFLGVGLFQQRAYRESIDQLSTFLNANGSPPKYGPDAAYLRFKAAEALFSRAPSATNGLLYLDVTKSFIRRYPRHRSIFEAYFRLGEYQHGQEEYLRAVESYQKVNGDQAFRVRADFAILQCYFSLFEALEAGKNGVGISAEQLQKRIASSLTAFSKSSAALEKQSPAAAKRVPLRNYRGRVSFMKAVFLSRDMDANAAEIASLLQDFETQYPEHQDAFDTVARTRLIALQKAGQYTDLENDVKGILTRYNPDRQKVLLAGLSRVLARDVKKLQRHTDQENLDNLLAAKRTLARLYADRLQRGEEFAEDESPERFKYELAQLYLDVKDYDKAVPLYRELQEGAYSLVALAGLAQIAAVGGNKQQALAYWEQMLQGTQVGDPIWFRGTFEVAQLNAALGNPAQGCRTVKSARAMLGRLGDQGLKKKIQDFTARTCDT